MKDMISRHGVSAWLDNMGYPGLADVVMDEDRFPSAQPEHLTDDDFETIRIYLSALKNELCNQRRWGEAKDYERLIDRFMSFASERPEITLHEVKAYCEKRCLAVVDARLFKEMKRRWSSVQPEQGWILCSEREPEHAGAYLVTTIVAVEKYVFSTWYSPKGGWMCEDRPEAWMPLPEPPKEDDYDHT